MLARIDPDRYRLEAERAEATYRKALADEQRARIDLERREALARDQLVAAEELNRSRGENERLAAESAAAKAARDIANQNVARSNVRPSRAGVVNTRAVQTGQFVQPGTVLATLVDTSRLRLRFKIGDAESLRARKQQTVKFRVASLGAREFDATVYHVSDVADPATRQVEVMAWVKNPGELKPGFFTEVTLASETRKGALVVPGGRHPGQRQGLRHVRGRSRTRRSCVRSPSACARAPASSRSSRASRRATWWSRRARTAWRTASRSRSRRAAAHRRRLRRPWETRSERATTGSAQSRAGGRQGDRERQHAGGHLDPQPRLRLDADGRA